MNAPSDSWILARLGYAVMSVRPDGEIVTMSPEVTSIVGYEAAETIGRNAIDLVHPQDLSLLVEARDYVVKEAGPYVPLTCRFRNSMGDWVWVEFCTVGVTSSAPDCFVIAFRSQDERLAVDESMRLLTEGYPLPDILLATTEAMAVGLSGLPTTLLWDRHDGRFCSAWHSRDAQAIGDVMDDLLLDSEDPAFWDGHLGPHVDAMTFRVDQLPPALTAVAAEHGIPGGWAAPIGPGTGMPTGVILLWGPGTGPELRPASRTRLERLRKVAQLAFDRERYEQQLLHAAAHDPLTGLINRARFFGVLERQTHRSPVAVIYVDLDLFKPVNDEFGHLVGDELLVEVARRIEDVVRPTDVVARLGGDEFAVLCTDAPGEDVLRRIGERLIEALRQPVRTTAGVITIGASVGMAMADAKIAPDTVIEAADRAVLEVKRTGRGAALLQRVAM